MTSRNRSCVPLVPVAVRQLYAGTNPELPGGAGTCDDQAATTATCQPAEPRFGEAAGFASASQPRAWLAVVLELHRGGERPCQLSDMCPTSGAAAITGVHSLTRVARTRRLGARSGSTAAGVARAGVGDLAPVIARNGRGRAPDRRAGAGRGRRAGAGGRRGDRRLAPGRCALTNFAAPVVVYRLRSPRYGGHPDGRRRAADPVVGDPVRARAGSTQSHWSC